MTTPYLSAGLYGPEAILGSTGVPAPSTPVTVYLTGTTDDADLFTDNTMATAASNPVTTDSYGNLAFYATAGVYDLSFTVGGVATVKTVLVEPWFVDCGMPSGSMMAFAGSAAPAGWHLCDGSAISRATYAALFAVISTTYGAGDGSTTFNVPDARGRSLIGIGGTYGSNTQPDLPLGWTGGEVNHTLASGEVPDHTHSVDDPEHNHGVSGTEIVIGVASGQNDELTSTPGGTSGSEGVTFTAAVDSAATGLTVEATTGGGGGHNTIHPVLAIAQIIKL